MILLNLPEERLSTAQQSFLFSKPLEECQDIKARFLCKFMKGTKHIQSPVHTNNSNTSLTSDVNFQLALSCTTVHLQYENVYFWKKWH